MKNDFFAYAKTKVQISCAVTAQPISVFVFATQYNSSSTYMQNFKFLAFFCDWTAQIVSDLVGNANSHFSRFTTLKKIAILQ